LFLHRKIAGEFFQPGFSTLAMVPSPARLDQRIILRRRNAEAEQRALRDVAQLTTAFVEDRRQLLVEEAALFADVPGLGDVGGSTPKNFRAVRWPMAMNRPSRPVW
jgi:hypothetical protein